ncbi:MAG: porin [Raineya sp.]|nr:porin [Raineya sp.]MDW8296282.1 porin [Raineya sp.]
MKVRFYIFCILQLLISTLSAQFYTDSLKNWKIETSAYVEAYYVFDFARPENNERGSYVFNHKRHNEFNVNHGIIETLVHSEKVRGHIALMIGTYSQYNLANEQELIRNIYEGNVGFKISHKHNLWLDAGIFSSHIGFESAISKDCWTLTRSLLADNTPYYEAGLKLTYTSTNERWILKGLLLNGWQRIKRLEHNSMPSFGTQVQFIPNKKITLNSSTYIGNEGTDTLKKMRFFHNFYGIFEFSKHWGLIVGLDIGGQNDEATQETNFWHASSTMLRYKLNQHWAFCGRAEHYWDRASIFIISPNGAVKGFRAWGFSLNIDYAPTENMLVRLEGRNFMSVDEIFVLNRKFSRNNFLIASSMAIAF